MTSKHAFKVHQDVRYDGAITDWEKSYRDRVSMILPDEDDEVKPAMILDEQGFLLPTKNHNNPTATSSAVSIRPTRPLVPSDSALFRAHSAQRSNHSSLRLVGTPSSNHLRDGSRSCLSQAGQHCYQEQTNDPRARPPAQSNSSHQKSPYEFGNISNAPSTTPFTFQQPVASCHPPERVVKKARYSGTVPRSSSSSQTLPHSRRPVNQSDRSNMDDQVMKDEDSDQNDNPLPYPPSGKSAATVTAATDYSFLKRAGKRPRKEASTDNKSSTAPNDVPHRDERQQSSARRPTRRPFAPPTRHTGRAPKSRITSTTAINTRRTMHCEEIYRRFKTMPVETKQYTRSDLSAVQHVRQLIKRCFDAAREGESLEELLNELRDRLHRMQFYDFMCEAIIREARLFGGDDGLDRVLYDEDKVFPYDLQADAMMLYNHFYMFGCDPHLLRGIKTTRRTHDGIRNTKTHALDPKCSREISANIYGTSYLVNGQWWPFQICALRDGAHGVSEGGIYGSTNKGAYSIVLGGGSGYGDEDYGDRIEYCGTSSDKKDSFTGASVPTEYTMRMLESCDRIHNEIRVLRKAAQSSKAGTTYSPPCGLRYDGVYRIVGKVLLDAPTSMYRFTLERCSGQDPIRFQGPERRPTEYEKQKFHELGSF
ncbi:MAG: hypothetical protein Q9223_007030 [Gallowayella weberi]